MKNKFKSQKAKVRNPPKADDKLEEEEMTRKEFLKKAVLVFGGLIVFKEIKFLGKIFSPARKLKEAMFYRRIS